MTKINQLLESPQELSREKIEAMLLEILAELRTINCAFPKTKDGRIDSEGHRRYHEQLIESAEAQTLFWRQMQLDVAKKGIFGLFTIVLGLALVGAASFIGLDQAIINRVIGR